MISYTTIIPAMTSHPKAPLIIDAIVTWWRATNGTSFFIYIFGRLDYWVDFCVAEGLLKFSSDALNDEVVQNSFASRDDRFLELVYCLIFIFLKRKMAFKWRGIIPVSPKWLHLIRSHYAQLYSPGWFNYKGKLAYVIWY